MKTMVTFIIGALLMNLSGIGFAEASKKDDGAEMIVKGNTDFTFDLYAQLKGDDGNLFFSPYSISTALAMTYAGAEGETARQMSQTFCWPQFDRPDAPGWMRTEDQFHRAFSRLIDRLNTQGQKGDYQLSVANALWGQEDYAFLDSFLELNKTHYKAGLETVDFVNEAEREKSRLKINRWVEDQTQNKIENLIPEGVLNALTRLVLTNAIYFKGDWANAFDAAKTKEAPFYVTPEQSVTASLMFQSKMFEYGQTKQVKVLKLPYKGDDLSMVVLLPREGHRLAEIEAGLTAETFRYWDGLTGPTQVRVYLPRFKMTSEFSLSQTLAAMGMPDAFNSKADFSGMDGTKSLRISAVLHKAFVEVNEEGTEAAAATGVVMKLRSMPPRPTEFRADKPFIFVIKDNNKGSVLFVGRVVDPTKE